MRQIGRIGRVTRVALPIAALLGVLAGGRGPGGRLALVQSAQGQTEADLTAARQLFAEALADEQAGRHSAALEKFHRVQAVRDTQAVRYRIATCLEALGQLRAALEAYTSTSIAAAVDTESASIARASRDKVEALSKRVARLVVTLSARAPADTLVKVDGEALQANTIGTPIVVDPGVHEITASGTGMTPFRARVTLVEGGQGTVEATLAPPAPAATPAPPPVVPPPRAAVVPEPPPSGREGMHPPSGASPHSARTTVGVAFLAGGGIFLAGATAILLVRHSDIQSLEAACPGDVCPVARASELESTRNRALVEGPIGVAAGAVGLVGAGVGIYLVATAGNGKSVALTPWADRSASGIALVGHF
jgi:hypothetical protein